MEQAENALRALLESETKTYAVLVAAGIGMMYGSLVGQIPEADQKAQEHLDRAIELGGEIGAKGTMGQAYLDLGLLYRTKGEKERARECIGTAVSLFEECELENRLRQAKEALESL
jgi:tetratricopeptide (TPR) repeat protein